MYYTAAWILLVLICFTAIAYYIARRNKMTFCSPCRPLQLFHKLCPAPQTVFQVQESDSVDEHLDRLAEALADKESSCYISKYKIQSTKQEMERAGDGSREKYRSLLEGLRRELSGAEVECRRIQGQIEWLAEKRAELHDEVQLGHRMYGRAATELASAVADLQQGRPSSRSRQVPRPDSTCYQTRQEVNGCRCEME